MIQRTKVAIDKDITLTTLLWYQGENDGIDKTLGVSFGHKLATILQDVCTNVQCHDFLIIWVNFTQWNVWVVSKFLRLKNLPMTSCISDKVANLPRGDIIF
jgi:hypothetical protein